MKAVLSVMDGVLKKSKLQTLVIHDFLEFWYCAIYSESAILQEFITKPFAIHHDEHEVQH